MGKFLARYFGHSGRVDRKTMWVGLIALTIVFLVFQQILYALFGLGRIDFGSGDMTAASLSAASENFIRQIPTYGWLNLIILAGFAYPISALLFKRSHDLNKSGVLVIVALALTVFYYILMIFGFAYTSGEIMGIITPRPTLFSSAVQLISGLLGLYLFVTLGFFAGTSGSNLYGTDPKTN